MSIALSTILGVLFIGLKLTHCIDWSWIWVLCPFWIGYAISIGFILVAFLFVGGMAAVFGLRQSNVPVRHRRFP